MIVTPEDAENFVLYQIAAVAGMASAEGLRLQHVKPHGALFNMAAGTPTGRGHRPGHRRLRSVTHSLRVAGSEILKAGPRGLRVAAEAFADRAYAPDGSLRGRVQAP